MKEPCRSCPEKDRDFGGCRCQAYLLTGDAANADPVCDLSPHHHLVTEAVARADRRRRVGRETARIPLAGEFVYAASVIASPLASSADLTVLFIAALAAETAVRLWLASRQIAAVCAHRERVPELFAGAIALAEQRRAADYTVARVASRALGDRVRGAAQARAHARRRPRGRARRGCATLHWREPWQGAVLVLAVLVLAAAPRSAVRAVAHVSHRGALRIQPHRPPVCSRSTS